MVVKRTAMGKRPRFFFAMFSTSVLTFKTFKKITNTFRGHFAIYLKLMKENQSITTCDRLALEAPLGSRLITHAQKSPLDIGCRTCGYLEWRKASILIETYLDKSRSAWNYYFKLQCFETQCWVTLGTYRYTDYGI